MGLEYFSRGGILEANTSVGAGPIYLPRPPSNAGESADDGVGHHLHRSATRVGRPATCKSERSGGSITCRSGKASAAKTAGRERLEGATIRIASTEAQHGWSSPPHANRRESESPSPRTATADPSSTTPPGETPRLDGQWRTIRKDDKILVEGLFARRDSGSEHISRGGTHLPPPSSVKSGGGRGRRGLSRAGRARRRRLKRRGGTGWKGPQSELPPPRRNTGGAARRMQVGENPGRHHRERQLRILHQQHHWGSPRV